MAIYFVPQQVPLVLQQEDHQVATEGIIRPVRQYPQFRFGSGHSKPYHRRPYSGGYPHHKPNYGSSDGDESYGSVGGVKPAAVTLPNGNSLTSTDEGHVLIKTPDEVYAYFVQICILSIVYFHEEYITLLLNFRYLSTWLTLVNRTSPFLMDPPPQFHKLGKYRWSKSAD